MGTMVAGAPRIEHDDGQTRVIAEVVGRAPLWFSVEDRFGGLVADRADHVLIGLLMPAMKEGSDLRIGGTVSDILLHQANGDLQRLLLLTHPDLHPIRVTADAVDAPRLRAAGVATGFSGGVDSFATLAEYFWPADAPPSLKVTHLLNNNVGAHGPHGDELWHARRARLAEAAGEFGLPFVAVDSNLDEHHPRIGFLQSVTLRNAAVAHLLGGGIGELLIASSVAFPYVGIGPSGSIARVDPMLVPLVSTSAVTVSSVNSGLSRVEKTLSLIGRPEARYLDVCTDASPDRTTNCSTCAKCLRTMLTLEMAGHLQDFCPATFSMERYLRERPAFVAHVLSADDPYAPELRAFATRIGWRWRPTEYARSIGFRVRRAAARLLHLAASTPPARAARRGLRRALRR